MKLTIQKDNGEVEIRENIIDLYIAYRQQDIVSINGFLTSITTVRSESWGSNIRELVKEIRQSLEELVEYLKGQRNEHSS